MAASEVAPPGVACPADRECSLAYTSSAQVHPAAFLSASAAGVSRPPNPTIRPSLVPRAMVQINYGQASALSMLPKRHVRHHSWDACLLRVQDSAMALGWCLSVARGCNADRARGGRDLGHRLAVSNRSRFVSFRRPRCGARSVGPLRWVEGVGRVCSLRIAVIGNGRCNSVKGKGRLFAYAQPGWPAFTRAMAGEEPVLCMRTSDDSSKMLPCGRYGRCVGPGLVAAFY